MKEVRQATITRRKVKLSRLQKAALKILLDNTHTAVGFG